MHLHMGQPPKESKSHGPSQCPLPCVIQPPSSSHASARSNSPNLRIMLPPWEALVVALLVSCSSGLEAPLETRLGAGTIGEPGKSRPLRGRFLHITGQPRFVHF